MRSNRFSTWYYCRFYSRIFVFFWRDCIILRFDNSLYYSIIPYDKIHQEYINVDSVRVFHLDVMYYVLIAAQCTMAFILTIVAFQILTNQEYNIHFLYIPHLVNYGIWISILAFLAYAFFSWYRNYNRNIMVLIFAFSMVAYVINGIFSLIGQLDMLVQQNPIISSNTIAYFPEFSIDSFGSHVETVSLISSTIAYILTWIGSVKLLYQTFKRFGKFKFWAIMISSLVYYNITFPFLY